MEQIKTLAEGLLAGDDMVAAEAAAEAAVALSPEDAAAWVMLGSARARQSKHKPAIAAFERALRITPNDVTCHTSLGELFIELGAYSQAAAALERAMSLDPNAEHPFGRRARALVAKTLQKLK